MKKIIGFLLLSLFFVGCKTLDIFDNPNDNLISIERLSTQKYMLKLPEILETISLEFDTNGRISGYSGLNRYFGKVEIVGNNIRITKLGTTNLTDPSDLKIKELVYLNQLLEIDKINLKKRGTELVLTGPNKIKLVFEKLNETL